MSKIPTAEEFFDSVVGYTHTEMCERAIEFAKLHVEAALIEADCNAEVTPIDHEEISEGSFRPIYGVDSSSILKDYPLTNIK